MEIAAVTLIALNLLPFLAGPGPVLDRIGVETGLVPTALSLLTLGPLALIGIGALAVPAIQNRAGIRPTVMTAILLIAAGCALRIVPSGTVLIATAAICGLGAALLQAVMPALIRERFMRHYGIVTSLYSAGLLAGGALGAQIVPLIAQTSGWAMGLAAMAVPAVAAFVLMACLPHMDMERGAMGDMTMRRILRQRRTWHLIACFAALNASYATVITWLGPQFAVRGLTPGRIGFLIAAMSVAQAAAALLLPPVLSPRGDRRGALLLSIACQAAGFTLLILKVVPPLITVVILGVGLGGTFALMIVALLDCAHDRDTAIKLASAVQGGGFLLNAGAPLLAAVVLEQAGGFGAVWGLHLALLAVAVPLNSAQPSMIQTTPWTRCFSTSWRPLRSSRPT